MKQNAQRRADTEIVNGVLNSACKVHEIRVTDETVNQAAVPLLISGSTDQDPATEVTHLG